ncbi:hypothetical protein [Tenacibaculum sp. IB213877]|uniref:hypothetical protein n=1 Tax=Tenacibaculum sp. IB213877 TaxID=3097351 RepID=UPI002A5ACD52|nr:hypothetical protein [Tenacibaculum sp. IB213877]MDY0779814.1 hypothetical protein [Tenacibaculum sp. IB213877]
MERFLIFLTFIISVIPIYSQVKIGDNPSIIHNNSILELESSDKVLVISRMSDTQMKSIQPLPGALVYNIDNSCVYTYNGTSWISLCDSTASRGINVTTTPTAPTNNYQGDFWINNSTNNSVSIWDGTQWIPIDTNPRRGNGSPTASSAPNPIAGDLYVDQTTAIIYAYDGTTWISSNTTVNANNGVFVAANNTIQLGGVLIMPTTITTDTTNTLSIQGLQNGDITQDDIITVDKATGVLKKITSTNLLREEVTELTANDGQLVFNGLNLRSTDKVNVYRNGVRIDFTIINTNTIEIEPEATCYQGDEIRIVQYY